MQLAEVGIFFPDSINMVSALRSGLMVHSWVWEPIYNLAVLCVDRCTFPNCVHPNDFRPSKPVITEYLIPRIDFGVIELWDISKVGKFQLSLPMAVRIIVLYEKARSLWSALGIKTQVCRRFHCRCSPWLYSCNGQRDLFWAPDCGSDRNQTQEYHVTFFLPLSTLSAIVFPWNACLFLTYFDLHLHVTSLINSILGPHYMAHREFVKSLNGSL